ncbi:MAG: hypothetical protein KKG09_00500 [Verrucomicrobia bacterium]|nr:hypothetical protein [Verrucomicrobiota bacterium]MCG2678484.1 hypothetical protein [Kiritimatiellia bacterium]MBU4247990.1 hypothetical protein [Verrucomicrobiota bacterium]MBU4289577.1 hypothetical protein [Verrucomicrobiota bacterium]MBU4427729.1 hypothetical protein [Verrucomicrobiota bacterium]
MDKQLHDEVTHCFAWDGFSFQVPRDWNLSEYALLRDVSWIRMEDDSAVRLDVEWTRSRRPIDMERMRKQFSAVAKSMTTAGAETQSVEELPDGWSAFLYSMPDGRHLLAAFRYVPGSDFFCLLKIHFKSVSRREPPRILHRIASTFQLHEQDVVPWELFDIRFLLNRDFRLLSTSFQAGRQLMIFEWRLRIFYLWFFSLADLVLREKSMEAWCATFLNGFKGIRGSRFTAGEQSGVILSRHLWRYPLGHIDEIVRMCFRYRAHCRHLAAQNQIALWVFQYRTNADLDKLALDVTPSDIM